MPEPFSMTFHVGWGNTDANAHMRNVAYLDMSVDVRLTYFQEHGFPAQEFERLHIGPVVMRDEVEYYRELRLLESVTVTLALAGLSEDGVRFRVRNEFYDAQQKLAARVTSPARGSTWRHASSPCRRRRCWRRCARSSPRPTTKCSRRARAAPEAVYGGAWISPSDVGASACGGAAPNSGTNWEMNASAWLRAAK